MSVSGHDEKIKGLQRQRAQAMHMGLIMSHSLAGRHNPISVQFAPARVIDDDHLPRFLGSKDTLTPQVTYACAVSTQGPRDFYDGARLCVHPHAPWLCAVSTRWHRRMPTTQPSSQKAQSPTTTTH